MISRIRQSLFGNIGKKIKIIAFVLFIVGVLFTILNLSYIVDTLDSISSIPSLSSSLGVWWLFALGTCVSWIVSCFVYGFGELIERVQEIAQNTKKELD